MGDEFDGPNSHLIISPLLFSIPEGIVRLATVTTVAPCHTPSLGIRHSAEKMALSMNGKMSERLELRSLMNTSRRGEHMF